MKHQIPSVSSSLLRLTQPSSGGASDTSTLELLSRWKQEDATNNAEEIRTAERELSEFKNAMNESRAEPGESPLYPLAQFFFWIQTRSAS